jgi:hypothetical protein
VGALVGLASALIQLAPVLGRGYVLLRDMVFVPRLPLTDQLLGVNGVPRAVPSDLVVALASRIVPGQVVQDLVLLAIIGLAGWGAARLVPGNSLTAAAAAAALYSWNPYLTERLLQGQWAVLVGYAALPWVAKVAIDLRADRPGSSRRLLVVLACAASGGASAELLAAIVAVPVVLWPGSVVAWWRRAATLVGSVVVVSLPWLIPGLMQSSSYPSDPIGVKLFSARPDTPFGTVGSLVSLGGIWNAQAVPAGRDTALVGLAGLVMTAAALWGLWQSRSRWARGDLAGLTTAGAAGFGLAIWGATPGARRLLVHLAASSAAGGLLRDGQRSLAPFVLLVAVGFGLVVRWATERVPWSRLLIAAPVLLLTSAAWGSEGALVAVHWPGDWSRAASATQQLRAGPILVLPWSSQRVYSWNGGRTLDDPAARWLPRRVVGDDALRVGSSSTVIEDPLARAINPTVIGTGPLVATLRARGYAGVLVELDQPGATTAVARLAGASLTAATATLAVYDVPRSSAVHSLAKSGSKSVAPVVVGDLGALVIVLVGAISLARIRTRRG